MMHHLQGNGASVAPFCAEEKDQDQENKGNVSVVSTMCDRTGLNGVHHVKEEKINAHLGQWWFPEVSQRKKNPAEGRRYD
jgi:hypothetical protein